MGLLLLNAGALPVSSKAHRPSGSVPSVSRRPFPRRLAVQARTSRETTAGETPSKERVSGRGWASAALAWVLSGTMVLNGLAVPTAYAARTLTAEEKLTISLFNRNTPSVVNITNLATRQDAFTLDLTEVPQGTGSGFIWDKQGHIITNFHVINGAVDLMATLNGGAEYKVKVVGGDPDKDVAVLEVILNPGEKEPDLQPVEPGESSDLVVGQKVFAIGNPFGLDHTLTTGVISGVGREIVSGNTGRPIQDIVQTDAAINPGNSGGPLLDSAGRLIGINTAIYSASGSSSGIGFAIPVDAVKSSVKQIIETGQVIRPILGISFAPDPATQQLGVQGVLVLDAKKGGPAWKAGIQGTSRDDYGRLIIGDIIVAANQKKLKRGADLYKVLDKLTVGDVVELEVLREKSKEIVAVTLEASPPPHPTVVLTSP